MPPPKKPKVGTSRVAEFLSPHELNEINHSLSSGSPQSCGDSDNGDRASTPGERRMADIETRPRVSPSNNEAHEGDTTPPRRPSLELRHSPAHNTPFNLSSSQYKLDPFLPSQVKSAAAKRMKVAGLPEEVDKTKLVQSLLTAKDVLSEKTSENGLVKHLMAQETPSSNILSNLFKGNSTFSSLIDKPKHNSPINNCLDKSEDNSRGPDRESRVDSLPVGSKQGQPGFENRKLGPGFGGETDRESSSRRSPDNELRHVGALNLIKTTSTEHQGWDKERVLQRNNIAPHALGRFDHDPIRENRSHSIDSQEHKTPFVHHQDQSVSAQQAQRSPSRQEKNDPSLATSSNSGPVFSEAYVNAVYCMAAMAAGKSKPEGLPPSPRLSENTPHSFSSSPRDMTTAMSKTQLEYMSHLPTDLQREALKIQSSAAAVAVVNAMRENPALMEKIGVDGRSVLQSGGSTTDPGKPQLLPSSGLSRHQMEILNGRQETGQHSWQMAQSSSGASTVQPHSPPIQQEALNNRLPGDVSVTGNQTPQEGTCVSTHHSPGPLNSPQEMPSSTMDDRRGRARSMAVEEAKAGGRRCQICDDTASGFHYGVWSCEGCKAFFKRSLQGPVDYVCPATNNCTIDKHRRKSCQACRLRKCLETGMSRGNCRKEKGPRGPNKQKRKLDAADHSGVQQKEPKIKKEIEENYPGFSITPQSQTPNTAVGASTNATYQQPSGENKIPVPIHPFVDHLMRIDPPVRFANHDNQLEDNHISLMTSMLKLADSELVDIINWAKAIPGYSELTLDDRIHLLESSWMEMLMLGLVWRSMPYTDVLVFAPDLPMSKERCQIADVWPTCQRLFAIVGRCRELKINREELVLLRITLLLNAEMISLQSNDSIKKILNKVNEAWHYTLITRLKHDPTRLTQLLLLLPHFRQSSMNAVAHIFELKRSSSVPIYDLLREMLEGQKEVQRIQGQDQQSPQLDLGGVSSVFGELSGLNASLNEAR